MLLIDGLLLQIAILVEICIKFIIFIKKLQKSPTPQPPSSLQKPGIFNGEGWPENTALEITLILQSARSDVKIGPARAHGNYSKYMSL